MKVKIKRVRGGSMGDQRQYGLVTGSIWNYEDTMPSNSLSSTIKESPRDEANIEAERGETVVGDLDGDGNLEHAKIGGKRHYEGGTPLNVPDGSFIFSDTSKMKIGNRDILRDIFGVNSKKPVTPATIAKKYELNKYKQMLEDPLADPMTKKTAQMMIDNNLNKLGQLALIQEGMKGFPDGIPDIAMPLFGSDMQQAMGGGQQGQMPMARYGGLPKAVTGNKGECPPGWGRDMGGKCVDLSKSKAEAIGKAKRMFGVSNKPPVSPLRRSTYTEADKQKEKERQGKIPTKVSYDQDLVNRMAAEAERKGLVTALPDTDDPVKRAQVELANEIYNDAVLSENPDKMYAASQKLAAMDISGLSTPLGMIGSGARKFATGFHNWMHNPFGLNTYLSIPVKQTDLKGYNPWGRTWQEKIYDMSDVLDEREINLRSEIQRNTDASKIQASGKEALTKLTALKKRAEQIIANPSAYTAEQVSKSAELLYDLNNDISATWYKPTRWLGYDPMYMAQKDVEYQPTTFANRNANSGILSGWAGDPLKLANEYYNILMGTDNSTQLTNSNTVPATTADTTQTGQRLENIEIGSADNSGKGDTVYVDPNKSDKDIKKDQVKNQGETKKDIIDDAVRQKREEAQRQLDSLLNLSRKNGGQYKEGGELKTFDGGGPFAQLIPETFIKDTDTYQVIKPNRFFDKTFGKQNFDVSNNYYTITDSKTGKKEALDLDDFVNRQSDVLKSYGTNGIADWKKDALSKDKNTREKAVEWFQNKYNEWRKANGLPEYFISKAGENPYGIDKKLGVYTWSAPGIKKKEATLEKPKEEPSVAEVKEKTKPGDVPSVIYQTGYEQAPWYRQDLANYYGSIMNAANVDKGPMPILQQINSPLVDSTFLDPARTINALQGNLNTTQSAIRAAQDGPSAMANLIAASASAAPNIANVIADYENKNVGIANQMGQLNNQIIRSDLSSNAGALKNYYNEMTTRDQQYDNAVADAANKVLKAYMQGETNRDVATSANVQNENYSFDPLSGRYYFKKGYDPKTGAPISEEMSPGELYRYYVDNYQLTPDQAIELITGTRSKSKTPAGNENKSKYGGYTYNPMDVIWNY